MAKLLKKETSLRNKLYKKFFIMIFIGVIFFAFFQSDLRFNIYVILFLLLLLILLINIINSSKILFYGIQGEKEVTKFIRKKISDDWFLINDTTINGAQTDHILFGPGGVFTIETKNYKGTISGKGEDSEWTHDVGKRLLKFRNPIKQGDTHSVALKKLLSKNGINLFVKTIVIFVSKKSELKIQPDDMAVFYLEKLAPYIAMQPNRLPEKEIDKIKEIIIGKFDTTPQKAIIRLA